MSLTRIALVSTVLLLLISWPANLTSCGPFVPQVAFTAPLGPPDPASYFSGGKLGVILPSFSARNLYAAWRTLNGMPLERAWYVPLQLERRESTATDGPATPSGPEQWLKARTVVPGLPPVQYINTYLSINQNGEYTGYENCFPSAFETAAATLRDREARWHASSPELRDWALAQDKVFANCAALSPFPDPAPPNASVLLRQDRAYQLAAAYFYARKWSDAASRFRSIAQDKSSPWRAGATYLVGRTFLREATVEGDAAAFIQAAKEFRAVLADPSAKEWQSSARGLLQFIEARTEPDKGLAEAGAVLIRPQLPPTAAQSLTDFISLSWDTRLQAPRKTSVHNDLLDWMNIWRNPKQAGEQQAVDRWRKTPTDTWLIAALCRATENNPSRRDLLDAASKLAPASPAYATAAYCGARLEADADEAEAARKRDEEALRYPMQPPDRNLFLAQRFSLASNWTGFLRYAPREAAYYSYGDMGPDVEPIDEKTRQETLQYANTGRAFDDDSVSVFNRHVPLVKWAEATRSPELPRNLQAEVAFAAWVRAIILNRMDEAKQLYTRWLEIDPARAELAAAYTTAPDSAEAHFAAIFVILRNPGFSPILRSGFGRLTRTSERDIIRDNWWCETHRESPDRSGPDLDFLTPADAQAGAAESEALLKTAKLSANYLPREAVRWASEHPEDPRNPEALARAVEATHYACMTDAETGPASKIAFDFLKQHYPSSPWAQKTKYWYK